jgi:hypothetical protein
MNESKLHLKNYFVAKINNLLRLKFDFEMMTLDDFLKNE